MQVPVLFEAPIASSLLGHFVGAVSGGLDDVILVESEILAQNGELDGFAGGAVFRVEIREDFGEGAAGEVAEFGAFGEFEFCERRFHLKFIVTERKKSDMAARKTQRHRGKD